MVPKNSFRSILFTAFLVLAVWLAVSTGGPAVDLVENSAGPLAFAPGAGTENGAPAADRGQSSPVVVNLRKIPPGQYDPMNQFDRWQRGEILLERGDSIIDRAKMEDLKVAAMNLPVSANISGAGGQQGINAPSAQIGFDSLDYTECCGGGGNVPPDPELAVGPNHVIAVVNVAFEIYDKSGTNLAGPTTFASFMSADPACTGVFDPNAIYDEEHDRYILGIDANGAAYCLAVSQTGDPTGAWNIYSFNTGNNFFDYPHAGVGRDAIYMGGNMFRCRGPFNCTFAESRVWAFDKIAMYNGQTAAFVSRALPKSEDTPQPLHLHGYAQGTWPASGPHYFFSSTNYNGATYSVFSWTNPFGSNALTKVGTVDLNAATGVTAGMPVNVPQLGGQTIQANDFRPQDFEFRSGFAWSVMTISCNPGSGTVNCVRWAKINPATATVVDAGVYGSNGEHRIFADLAVDACENMAVGYTKSSTGITPSIFYNGRHASDPAGTLQAENLLKSGEIAYTSFETSAPRRWGDYTEMTIDPAGTTFWYLGEYSKNTGTTNGRWGTYVGSFTYNCDPGGPVNSAPVVTITAPPDGQNFPSNTNISFQGTAFDNPDGDISADLVWYSDQHPNPIGTGASFSTVLADGTHNITASVTDSGNLSGSDSVTITVGNPQPGNTMHVSAIDMTYSVKGKNYDVRTTVTIVDQTGAPVANATVDLRLTLPDTSSVTGSGATNGQGQVTFSYKSRQIGTYTATVTGVTHSGFTYNPGANVETSDTLIVP